MIDGWEKRDKMKKREASDQNDPGQFKAGCFCG
jgi:hypothetical protein